MSELLELTVGPVANGGWCVARHEGRVVFVRHALPGERVRCRVTEETTRFLRADAVEILEASPDRVPAPCPFSGPGRCGGCDWQHASLAAQRRLKAEVVAEQLQRLAGITRDVVVEEVPGAAGGLGWRTRVQFAADRDGRLGLRRHRSHEIERVDECLIADPAIEDLRVSTEGWRGAATVEFIASTGGDRAVIVTPKPHRDVRIPDVDASVMIDEGRRGTRVLQGRGTLVEHVAGRDYRVSASGFWQVHPGAAATLQEAVLDFAQPKPGEWALDLYCGVGLFAAALAEAVGPAGAVLGIESEPPAVQDARHNLRDLPQAQTERGKVEEALDRLGIEQADLVVCDPPRSGLGRPVVTRIASLTPSRIVYVSCDPATLSRDLNWFTDLGYDLSDLRAFDQYPMTHHVECVALLVAR
ncbi:putative RNA methyltransferase [Acrocarpospora phusangensis]|uniref:RNA methyltransferase n=1 Tax=Acrocarpospora phusangensis TaxID=1070424 RepID=A0A919UU93_9ACTN|nr:class I SAM-dependent RNA methyltransferase [Acrocarpospora phusangensis]GIH28205.1 putative RNA methyltransferase [Acrocarpospora phusangensis]